MRLPRMDYNSFSDSDYGHQIQQNDVQSDAARGMFGWMSSHSQIPPESLPRAPEPVVYEGFVPDAYPGLMLPAAAPTNKGRTHFDSTPLPVLHHPFGEDNNGQGWDATTQSVEASAGTKIRSNMNTDAEITGNTPPTDEAASQDGLQAGTRPKRGRKPRKPYAKSKKPKKGEGKRGGWCKGIKVGPRPVLEASAAFNKLYSEAVDCLLAETPNPQKALELITEAIAMNPEQHNAHPVLAEAHHKLGNDQKAIDVLFVGAHSNPRDPETWRVVVEQCLKWTGIGRRSALEKALVACTELINIDKDDYQARFQRAAIHREQGKAGRCINELSKVLKAFPYNSSAMEEYARACIDLDRVLEAIDLYKEAIEYYMEIGLGDVEDNFEWCDVGMYADLVARNGQPSETLPTAIRVLKKLSRWLQGRQVETYWDRDSLKDDAEFDMADEPRRICVPEYMPARRLPEAYGLGLPIEIRAQLGILRLRRGDRTEALGHFEWLIEPTQEGDHDDVHQIPDLFLQVARALADTKEHAEALRFYEALQRAEAMDNHDFWTGIGHSSFVCDKKEQALDYFRRALACNNESVEAKTWIAKLLIEQGDKPKAIEYLTEAVETAQGRIVYKEGTRVYEKGNARLLREEAERTLKHAHTLIGPKVKKKYNKRKHSELDPEPERLLLSEGSAQQDGTPTVDERQGLGTPKAKRRDNRDNRGPRPLKVRLLPEEDEMARHERILQYYTTLLNNTEAMRSGDSVARGIWIDCAKSLIEDFRSTKVFFPKDHHEGAKALANGRIEAINRLRGTPISTKQNSRTPSQTPVAGTPVDDTAPTLATTYRSILFTSWLDIFLEYALLLSGPPPNSPPSTPPDPSNKRPCYDIIHTALSCVLFSSDPSSIFQIQICHLICTLAFRDEKTLFKNVLRWFMREHAFCTDAYRLFGAMNFYFPYFTPADGNSGGRGKPNEPPKEAVMQRAIWRSQNTVKALRRHVHAVDKSLADDYADPIEGPVPRFMREERHETFTAFETQTFSDPNTGATKTQRVVLRAEEMDVVLLVLYGQILYATGSFVSALSYFYRARAIDPDNPLVLLSIALSYMHQMLKKGETNRHVMVLQGWAIFQEYEDKRLAWARGKEDEVGVEGVVEEITREIGFNKARCWEMLGCAGLAGREYERLLVREGDLIDPMLVNGGQGAAGGSGGGEGKEREKDEKWTMEAAYAMSNMYLMGGDKESARIVTERFLVVE